MHAEVTHQLAGVLDAKKNDLLLVPAKRVNALGNTSHT